MKSTCNLSLLQVLSKNDYGITIVPALINVQCCISKMPQILRFQNDHISHGKVFSYGFSKTIAMAVGPEKSVVAIRS